VTLTKVTTVSQASKHGDMMASIARREEQAPHMVDIDALVPNDALGAFLDEHIDLGRGEPLTVVKIGEGKSNLTFRVERGGHRWVLRRPPMGDLPETAHDMLREHRVLTALDPTAVRTPSPLIACEDPEVLGVPFYLMEVVDGVVIRDTLPADFTEEHRRGMGFEMVDALAELHTLDYEAAGLGDLGRPDGYTARQVKRWTSQWEFMRTRELPDIEAVQSWLAAHVPTDAPRAIVHGDYKMDNVVYSRATPPRVEAILDWEMATLGDPLTDLGYLMVFWPEAGEDNVRMLPQPTQLPGFPTRAEMIARYEQLTGFSMHDLTFYRTLAIWKLAILSEGLYKRFLAGKADSEWFAVLEQSVPAMAATARQWSGA
jgi:aminoglycoside phosphotransferase (APT) family kinase protein